MTLGGEDRRLAMGPPLAAAALLHLFAFLLLAWLGGIQATPMGSAVPITLVADDPTTDSAPAIRSDAPQRAATPTPAAGNPSAPLSAPTVPQPPARPVPAPRTLASRPAAAAALTARRSEVATKPPPSRSFSLAALAASVAKAEAAAARAGRGRPGPARPRQALEARVDAGSGVSQSDMAGLQGLLERLWNPDCAAESGKAIVVPVEFAVDDAGRLDGMVTDHGEDRSADPATFAAARRAIDAVHQAEPYAAPFRGKRFTIIFDAKKACANR